MQLTQKAISLSSKKYY